MGEVLGIREGKGRAKNRFKNKVEPRLELGIKDLQSSALPLGYTT
jgi:hypothetical protein